MDPQKLIQICPANKPPCLPAHSLRYIFSLIIVSDTSPIPSTSCVWRKEWRSWYEKKNQEEWEEKRKVILGKKAVISEKEKGRERKREGNDILLECCAVFLLSSSLHSKHHLWNTYPHHLIFHHSAMTSLDRLLCYHHGTTHKPFGLVTEVWNVPLKRQSPAEKEAFPPAWICEETSILLIQGKSTSVLFLSLPPSHSSFQLLCHLKE